MEATRKTIWKQGGLAVVLALVAGYVDAYAFLAYSSYASFMSGNTTQTGLRTGVVDLAAARHNLLPIPFFVAGVFAGTLLLHARLRHPARWLFAAIAALLATALLGAGLGPLPNWCGVALLAVAMGAMNTTVARVGAQPVSLGYVTGSLNNFAQHLALAVRRLPVPQAAGSWDTHRRRAALLGSVWVGFLTGAFLGGATMLRLAVWALVPPILILAALAAYPPTPVAIGERRMDDDPGVISGAARAHGAEPRR